MIQRRSTIPQELDDPEDIRVNQESFLEDVEDDDNDNDNNRRAVVAAASTTLIPPPTPKRGDTTGTTTSTTTTTTMIMMMIMQQIHQWPKEIRNLLAGGLAGMVAKSVVAPLDRIKIMYQVTNVPFHFHSLPHVMKRIVRTEGLDALWKGNVATMVRIFPYSGIQFMTYDRIKSFFLQRHVEHNQFLTLDRRSLMIDPLNNNNNKTSVRHRQRQHGLTPLESLVAGMTAGTCSVICTYPLDLTRAQLAVLKKHKRHEHLPNKSFVGILVDNYAQRGLVGLFRGITPTIIGILPYSGIAFTLNEQGKREWVIGHTDTMEGRNVNFRLCLLFH
eukprot:scaffold17644_cov170-Amphora_coffeaeformis.AAC.1